MEAQNGSTVRVHYTGKLEDGTVFDSSEGREPLEFTIGQNQVIPGFENAVVGKKSGDDVEVDIPANQAYGRVREELVSDVPKDQLPSDLEAKVGDQLQAQDPAGQVSVVTVTEVCEESITVDGNHPLAGKDLTFNIKLVNII